MEVHPGAAARAVRPRHGSRRAAEPRRPGTPARARVSFGHRAAPSPGAGRAARPGRRRRLRAARLAREAGRARLRQRPRFVGAGRVGCRPQRQDRRVPDAQHPDARGAHQPARGPPCRQPRSISAPVQPRRRQLRGPLLRRPRAHRPEAMARRRCSVRKRPPEDAHLLRRLPGAGRRPRGGGSARPGAGGGAAGSEGAAGRSASNRTRGRPLAPAWRRRPGGAVVRAGGTDGSPGPAGARQARRGVPGPRPVRRRGTAASRSRPTGSVSRVVLERPRDGAGR